MQGYHVYNDYLRLFDGDSYNRKYLINQLTGTSLPSDVSSVASKMLITFDSYITHSLF